MNLFATSLVERRAMRLACLLVLAGAFVVRDAAAATPRPAADPLVLDLKGDGVDLSGQTTTSLLGGPARKLRWTRPKSDDAFVAADATALASVGYELLDGSGARLSGLLLLRDGLRVRVPGGQIVSSDDAFELLGRFDATGDGRVDASDVAYAHLRVWNDANADGAMQPAEIGTLAERRVRAIALRHGEPRPDANGNVLTEGTYESSDGAFRRAVGVVLAGIEAPPPSRPPTPIAPPPSAPRPAPPPSAPPSAQPGRKGT